MQRLFLVPVLCLTLALPGCIYLSDLTDDEEEAPPIVDTTPPPAPFTPQASYDFPGSKAASDAGHATLAQGQTAAAIEHYEAAIGAWPANPEAWAGLAAAYREEGRGADLEYALFFARRIDWAESSPASSVAASFRNVAAGRIARPVEDERTRQMAEQLALYYAGLDVAQRMAQLGSRAEPEQALDAVGIVPAIIGTAAMSIFTGAQLVGIFLVE
ncbi:MAG: tetratricopeptide repeat protein [Alphaproteobacteria bacterium]